MPAARRATGLRDVVSCLQRTTQHAAACAWHAVDEGHRGDNPHPTPNPSLALTLALTLTLINTSPNPNPNPTPTPHQVIFECGQPGCNHTANSSEELAEHMAEAHPEVATPDAAAPTISAVAKAEAPKVEEAKVEAPKAEQQSGGGIFGSLARLIIGGGPSAAKPEHDDRIDGEIAPASDPPPEAPIAAPVQVQVDPGPLAIDMPDLARSKSRRR